MAKEASINAALSPESTELANWLTRELRVVRATPSAPPVETEAPSLPPPPSLDEPAAQPATVTTDAVAAPASAVPAVTMDLFPAPVEAPPPPQELPAPIDAFGTESAAPVAAASDVRHEEPAETDASDALAAAGGLYGVNSDWSSDDDAFFASAPDTSDEALDDERLDDEDLVAGAAVGTSLSPQVLESEDDEGAAPLPLPGVGGNPYVKVAAGVAAALLLVFFFVHHRSPKPAPETAAPSLPAATVTMPAPPTDPGTKAEPPAEGTAEAKATGLSKGGGLSDFGGKHAPPADGHDDPFIPGGPSVARFPDLPRDILNALEQAFESGDGKKDANKPQSDAVGGYQR